MINSQLPVIPAEAGIHVFQSLEWTPDPRLRASRTGFSGVTASFTNYYIVSVHKVRFSEKAVIPAKAGIQFIQ